MTAKNTEEQENAEGVVVYKDMSWQKLKALMTAEGQKWVNAEHAIEYLTKLDADDDSEDADAADSEEESGLQETDAGTNSNSEEIAEKEDAVLDEADDSADADATDIVDTNTDDDVVGDDDLVDGPVDETPRFDPDDKHGVISGQTNARYWQNGCHYDSQGEYIAHEDVVVESEETD